MTMKTDHLFFFGLIIVGTSCKGQRPSCTSCPSLDPKKCPLLNECNVCTQTIFTTRSTADGCLEIDLTCPPGSHVILELKNKHVISRNATSLGSFICEDDGIWKLHALNYTERNVISASCYQAAPDRQESPIDIWTQMASWDSSLVDMSLDYALNDGDSMSWGGNATTFTIKTRHPYTNSKFSASQNDGVTYALYQMHAHWGHQGTNGSEHLMNGRRYLAEFHFVHYDPEYGTFDNSVGKENGIAVIAIFAELGPENIEFDKILRAIQTSDFSDPNGRLAHLANQIGFNYKKLIPALPYEFMAYTGSLTTGDFNTCVDWTVMRKPITLSQAQMNVLYSIVHDNFREPQPILPDTIIRKNFA